MRHGVSVAHLDSEEEYFHRLDAELIDESRKRAAAEEEHRRMAEASQIEDPKMLELLEKLGYTHTTVILLHLVPLVEVAWIDGSVSSAERDRILALASQRGLNANAPAYQQLMAWLDQRPSQEFFEGTWRAIQMEFESLPADERKAGKDALMQSCTEFASATCERFGWTSRICGAKRKLLREIARRLDWQGKAEGPAALTGSAHAA